MAMNIQTLSLAPTNNTDANFRLWGSAVSTAIAAVGLVQTSDTGQINWTTVTRPTSAQQVRGYEMWRFNDSLQSSTPVFIRLDYGATPTFTNTPGIYVAIGTATDGAGLLTSATSFPNTVWFSPGNPAFPYTSPASWFVFYGLGNDYSSTSLSPLYVASDGGSSLMIAGWYNAVGSGYPLQSGGMTLIERMRDQDGSPNNNGLFALRTYATSGAVSATLMLGRASSFYGVSGTAGAPVLNGAKQGCVPASGLVGTVLNTFPVFTGTGPQLNGPSKHLVAVWSADQSVNTQFDVTVYGTTGTYRSLGTHSSTWTNEAAGAVTGAFRIA